MDIWLAFVAGIIVGALAFCIKRKSDVCGNLRIDRSQEGEEPYLFLELSCRVDDICNKKYVAFEVYDKSFTHK